MAGMHSAKARNLNIFARNETHTKMWRQIRDGLNCYIAQEHICGSFQCRARAESYLVHRKVDKTGAGLDASSIVVQSLK